MMNEPHTIESPLKEYIARSFGQSADYYEKNADLQKEVAGRLIASLKPWKEILPEGPILEIGCGTGYITEGLIEVFPDRQLEITDISEGMVGYTRKKIGDRNGLSFYQMDGEQLKFQVPKFAMTISGFAAQWFRHPAMTLGKCIEATLPGGLLLASFPGSESFPEWKTCCRELGLPYTGNALPDTEEMVVKLSGGPVQVDYYEDTITQHFSGAAGFFHHLKKLGAGVRQKERGLTPNEMKMLIKHWDQKTGGDIVVSFHVVFLAIKRNYDS